MNDFFILETEGGDYRCYESIYDALFDVINEMKEAIGMDFGISGGFSPEDFADEVSELLKNFNEKTGFYVDAWYYCYPCKVIRKRGSKNE